MLGGCQFEVSDLNAAPLGLSYCGNLSGATGKHPDMNGKGIVITCKRSDLLRGYQYVLSSEGNYGRFYGGNGYEEWIKL